MTDYDPWAAAAEVRTADRWRSAAAGWNSALTRALLDSADLRQSSFVLDVAAGSGDPTLYIAQRLSEGSVVALDSSRSALLLAKRQTIDTGLGSKLRFVQADAHQLPFSVPASTASPAGMGLCSSLTLMPHLLRCSACSKWAAEPPFWLGAHSSSLSS